MAKQLEEIVKILENRFPTLRFILNSTTNQDNKEVRFIDAWNPRPNTSTGLTFLPTFHIIVTPSENNENGHDYMVQLMTFHGKIVLEDQITVDVTSKKNPVPRGPSGFDLFQGLCDCKYMLCAGVSLVNKKRLIRCLRRVKATHVDKVRNFFTLEPFNEDSVLRSRKCLFAVTEEEDLERKQREAEEDARNSIDNPTVDYDGTLRCTECDKFQFKIQRVRKELDGDEDLFKETEKAIEDGSFRVMKDDNRALFWNQTVPYTGSKIAPMDLKKEVHQYLDSDEEDWPAGNTKRSRTRSDIVKVESVKMESDLPPEFAMTCTICLHTYPSLNSYEIDQRRHAKAFDLRVPVKCPVCGPSGEQIEKKDLTVHFNEQHPDLGTCCCECLEIMSPEDDSLRKHMLKNHSEALKSKCPLCPTTFTEKYRLKVHIKQMHEKTPEAICDHCGKLFGHRSLMVKHRRLAHGAKTFVCTICEKGFTSIFALNKHLNVHSGLKPFKCVDCEYRSCRLTNVWLHVKKMHGRKGTHADVEVFEDELKQMQAMELDNVPYKPQEYAEGLDLDEVYVQTDDIQSEVMADDAVTEIVIQHIQEDD